jgi:CBS domain-containing protein
MSLLQIASVPAATVSPQSSVIDAVKLMSEKRVGAVAVVEKDDLVGIFTERDVMTRVVLEGKDPKATKMSEVMTADVETALQDMPYGDCLRVMVERHFRHLPVIDAEGRVQGMLSVRDLLQHAVEDLSDQLDSMVKYFSADGPGG